MEIDGFMKEKEKEKSLHSLLPCSVAQPATDATKGDYFSLLPKDVLLLLLVRYLDLKDAHRLRRCCKLMRVFIDNYCPPRPPPLQFSFTLPGLKMCDLVLVGTHCDLGDSREVSREEAQRFASKHNLEYFETSSFTRSNVDESFLACVRQGKSLMEEEEDKKTGKKCTIQ